MRRGSSGSGLNEFFLLKIEYVPSLCIGAALAAGRNEVFW